MFVIGFFSFSASLLIQPVREEFAVNLEQVMDSLTYATLAGFFIMPLAGLLADKLPVRWLMAAGLLVYSLGLYALAQSHSITEYVFIFAFTMAIANSFAGSLPASTVISRWFTTSRGRALGISAIGTSVGGIAIPAIVTWWIADAGWRVSLEYLSLCILLFVLPFVVLTVRGKPQDVGMQAEASTISSSNAVFDSKPLSVADILSNSSFWYISLSLGLLFSTYSSVLANISPYVTNLGHSETRASSVIMAIAIFGFVGKIAFGVAADKFNLRSALWLAQLLALSGFLVLAFEPGFALILVAAMLMGIAAGGMLPVWGAMIAKQFGLLSYGHVMGLMGPVITLCVLPGYSLIGKLFDATGSYTASLLVFAAATVIAGALLLPLKIKE
jgi:MFS family permease